VLSGAVTADGLRFDWTWPAGATAPVTLERSADGNVWKRMSPPLNEGQSSFDAAATGAPSQYRLNVRTSGGRGAISNVIVV
jgi:hypothetical protein